MGATLRGMNTSEPADLVGDAFAALIANPAVQTALTVMMLLWIALYAIAAIGTYHDIVERTGQRRVALAAAAFVLVATPFAFPLALLLVRALRPSDASRDREAATIEARVMAAEAAALVDCPTCATPLPADWLACPADGALVRARCAACKGAIPLNARACPLCAAGAVEVG